MRFYRNAGPLTVSPETKVDLTDRGKVGTLAPTRVEQAADSGYPRISRHKPNQAGIRQLGLY